MPNHLPNCSVYDGADGYRLADISSSRFFRHSVGGMHYHLHRFPASLAARFLREYKHPGGPVGVHTTLAPSAWTAQSQ